MTVPHLSKRSREHRNRVNALSGQINYRKTSRGEMLTGRRGTTIESLNSRTMTRFVRQRLGDGGANPRRHLELFRVAAKKKTHAANRITGGSWSGAASAAYVAGAAVAGREIRVPDIKPAHLRTRNGAPAILARELLTANAMGYRYLGRTRDRRSGVAFDRFQRNPQVRRRFATARRLIEAGGNISRFQDLGRGIHDEIDAFNKIFE